MGKYLYVAYFGIPKLPYTDSLPSHVRNIVDWTWEQSAVVRWLIGDANNPLEVVSDATRLAVFNWRSGFAKTLKATYKTIRSHRPDLPILVVRAYGRRDPVCHRILRNDHLTYGVDINDLERQNIGVIFEGLGTTLPPPILDLGLDPGDFVMAELITLLGGEDCLKLVIQKFFPDATRAEVRSVGGGWSTSKLCRIFIEGDSREYFIKFFMLRKEYSSELTNHHKAQQWLGDNLVKLKLIPEIEGGVTNQSQAFPETSRAAVCYESASTREYPRCTLRDIYRDCPEDIITKAVLQCMKILAENQNERVATEAPWREDRLHLTNEAKATILATVDDLNPYGPAICHNNPEQWREYCRTIKVFVHDDIPKWLLEPIGVKLGHIHGDPNPRNCLVFANDCENIRFIDSGAYDPNGRLLSDLSIIERDIKLVLMGIEKNAGNNFDLNMGALGNWYQAEQDSILRGLEYRPEHCPPAAPNAYSSSHRTYKILGYVRQRAKELCGDWDKDGKHYFALLLFWTLDILRYNAVRPTKKLLAICSVAEILNRF